MELPFNPGELKVGVDSPYCSKCGKEMSFNARRSHWTCSIATHDTIPSDCWRYVLLHSAAANKVLQISSIEMLSYGGVAIDRLDAVSPSHILPIIVQAAKELANGMGKAEFFMLDCVIIEDTERPTSLMDAVVRVASPEAPLARSLSILCSTVEIAISKHRSINPSSTILASNIFIDS